MSPKWEQKIINPFEQPRSAGGQHSCDHTTAAPSSLRSGVEHSDGFSRRRFLGVAAGAATVASMGISAAVFAEQLKRTHQQLQLNPLREPWLSIDAVQQQLLPAAENIATDGPGAREIQALAYLQTASQLPQFDPDTNRFLRDGVGWLNDLAKRDTGQTFVQLDVATQQGLITRIAQSRAGENWLSTLLTYLLEALFAAPAYGVNPDGIGWHWLKHSPGVPQPGADNLWYKLV